MQDIINTLQIFLLDSFRLLPIDLVDLLHSFSFQLCGQLDCKRIIQCETHTPVGPSCLGKAVSIKFLSMVGQPINFCVQIFLEVLHLIKQ